MDEQTIKRNNILYVAIGVMTLIITTIGATFAYYTATESNGNVIGGNMATINFELDVAKVTTADTDKGGLIPMTNSMVEKAVSNASEKGICVDDNNNAVCQIYKITVTNDSSASMFVDGYVTLTGGSGVSTDYTTATTTMRWAQIFCSETNGTPGACTTAGITTTRATTTNSITGIDASWTALGLDGESQADDEEIQDNKTTVTSSGTTQGNSYDIIKMNYIRVSKHTGTRYTQVDDVTSALVYNQYLNAKDDDAGNDTGDSYNSNSTTTDKTYKDAQVYYIAVWLSETGTNQTIGSGGTSVPNETANFFQGSVTFISAQGSEVTATFAGYDAVTPDTQS